MPGWNGRGLPWGRLAELQRVRPRSVLDRDRSDEPLRLPILLRWKVLAGRGHDVHRLFRVLDWPVQPDGLHQLGGHCVWTL